MKNYLIALFLLSGAFNLLAEPADSTKSNKQNAVNDLILFVNVTNPLFYGKAGAAFTIRNERKDIFFYANYRYVPGVFGTKAYFSNGVYGSAKPRSNSNINGFDLGAQIRFRDPSLSRPYSAYIKDVEKHANFYSGVLFELTYTHSEFVAPWIEENSSSWTWEPKVGGLIGWSFQADKVFFDIHTSLALGFSMIDYRGELVKRDFTVGLLRYDVCFLVGYKF
jgi:hypothetical protein